MAGVPHGKTRPAPATVANRTGVEGTQNIRRKSVRGQGCPEKGVGHPSLPDHPRPYRGWLSWRERQKKRGVGRAEKSPESERTRAPQGGSTGPACLRAWRTPRTSAQTPAQLRPARQSRKTPGVCLEHRRPSCPGQDSCRQLPANGVGLDPVT